MGEQSTGIEGLSVEDCRKLLAEGKVGEGLQAIERLMAVHPDLAALHHYRGVALHMAGRSGEALEHFEKAHTLEPDQAAVYQNQSIALLVSGQVQAAAEAARKAISLRPRSVGAYANLALAQARLGDYAGAQETIDAGLEQAPGNAGLLTQAAHTAIETRNWAVAESRVAEALAVAPDSVDALYNAAALYQALDLHEKALAAFEAVLRRQPGHDAAFINRGVALRNLGRSEAAIHYFRKALERRPDWAVLRYNLAVTRLYHGDWAAAWDDFELRFAVANALEKSPKLDTPRWNGADMPDKTLLIVHEQGFGDTFQFIRFLPLVQSKAARVIFVCPKRLYPVLSRLDMFRSKIELVSEAGPIPDHDAHLPLMSLARLARMTPETVPLGVSRIALDAPRLERWRTFAAGGRPWRIGLSWQGNPTASVDRGRSIAASEFAPLGLVADRAQFISLQRYVGLDQPLPDVLGAAVPDTDFDEGDDPFLDTAAMMMSLDLVITSDTSVAHLAGLLGRPVWLLLKKVPDWRWGGEGMLSPWYPTMRIFRQTQAGNWGPVFEEVAGDLDLLISTPQTEPVAPDLSMEQAMSLHGDGRYSEAVVIYRALLAAGRGDAQVQNFLGMALLEGGSRSALAAQAGLAHAAYSVALKPAVADFWSNLAVLLDSLSAQNDSRRALAYALLAQPGHLPSTLSLAKKLSSDGKGEKALDMLAKLLARDPTSQQVLSAVATVHTDLGRYNDAERALRRILDRKPDDAKLWVQLGAIQSRAGRPQAAAESWEKALVHEPDNADALSNLGVHERNHGELGLSIYLQRRAVECDPAHAEGWNNLGIAELEAAHDAAAAAAFRQAIAVRPNYADAHLALGMTLLNSGDYRQGLQHYEWRLKSSKLGISTNRPNIPYWTGGDPAGLAFFLMAEQGFGDAFQFSRYARWLKERGASKIYIGCREAIGHLLGTIPGVDGVYVDGSSLPNADVMAFMMSMPGLTGLQLDTIPSYESYISADPERVTKWAEWLGAKPGLRVGVVWQGNPDPKVDKGRSYPLTALEPLSRIAGVRLIALQKGKGEEQIEALNGRFEVERPGPDFDNGPAFADTAAMMMNLDLVVTSDTGVAHLAGALGRPCWVVLKAHPEWRWLTDRSDSPWYPNSRLFRRIDNEAEDAPFGAVMTRLANALTNLAAGDLSERHRTEPGKAAAIVPFDPVKTYNHALTLQRAKNTPGAIEGLAKVLDVKQLRSAALHMLGTAALHQERNARAVLLFREAERLGVATPEFLTNFSIGLRRVGRLDDAKAYLGRALAIKPTAEAHLSLGNIHRDEASFEQALHHYSKAIDMNPSMSKAHRGMGNLMRDMHRPTESLAAFERARKLDGTDPDLILDHAHAKMFDGDYVGGFRDYEARWGSREVKPRTFREPRWDGSDISDKTLLVHGEQGFGDNIQFVRFVPEAARRAGRLILEVREPLIGLFRTLGSDVPIEIVEQGKERPAADLEVPMMSLPALFGTTVDTVPPPPAFAIDPARVGEWRKRFDSDRVKVGLIWQGNPKARADQGRSPPLSALEPLFSVSGTQFVSLQKTDGLDQIKASAFASEMILPGQALGDFLETAAAILALDIVVSSCTATLHLAASLGVPVLGMLKYHADWRWLNEREDSPWYPTLRLFRQTTVGDWSGAVTPLREALADFVARA